MGNIYTRRPGESTSTSHGAQAGTQAPAQQWRDRGPVVTTSEGIVHPTPKVPSAERYLLAISNIQDDDFWLAATPYAPIAPNLALPIVDGDFAPQTAATNTFDEDFWLARVQQPAATFVASSYYDETIFPIATLVDEDYVVLASTQLAPYPRAAFADQDEIPAGALFGQDDEDFWRSNVAPTLPVFWFRQPVGDQDEIPATTLFGQSDEDFWQSGVAPVLPTFTFRQPVGDQDELPAATLTGQPDEDFARLPQILGWAPPPLLVFDTPEVVTTPAVVAEEDAFQLLPPWPLAWPRPVATDPDEDPILFGQPDEDFWQSGVAPTVASFFFRQPIGDQDEIPATTLFGQDDEDFWSSGVAPALASMFYRQPGGDQDELVMAAPADEDFWRSSVAPTVSSFTYRQPVGDQDELPAATLSGQPDEDFWQSGVSPVVAALTFKLQIEQDEVQTPTSISPDEDFWRSNVAPIVQSFVFRQPVGDQDEIPATTLFGQPDEDFWRSGVPPVLWGFVFRQPVGDQDEIPTTLSGQPDEDYWQSGVAPVVQSFFFRQPVLDQDEIPALVLTIDEDLAQIGVMAPVLTYARVWVHDEIITGAVLATMVDDDPGYVPPPFARASMTPVGASSLVIDDGPLPNNSIVIVIKRAIFIFDD